MLVNTATCALLNAALARVTFIVAAVAPAGTLYHTVLVKKSSQLTPVKSGPVNPVLLHPVIHTGAPPVVTPAIAVGNKQSLFVAAQPAVLGLVTHKSKVAVASLFVVTAI